MNVFQYKVLHSIVFTNSKPLKIVTAHVTTVYFLYSVSQSRAFWDDFESLWFSRSQEKTNSTKRDVIERVISRMYPLLN